MNRQKNKKNWKRKKKMNVEVLLPQIAPLSNHLITDYSLPLFVLFFLSEKFTILLYFNCYLIYGGGTGIVLGLKAF